MQINIANNTDTHWFWWISVLVKYETLTVFNSWQTQYKDSNFELKKNILDDMFSIEQS